MNIELTQNETRVIGCLMEKSITTPEQYPLTLNALTNACNQKSSRDPVLSLDPGVVERTVRELQEKHFILTDANFKGRVEKYTQRFCNTRYSDLQFSEAEFAVICLLLLRGAQTPGELKARSGRLFEFADNEEVTETLQGLIGYKIGPLVARLPIRAGRRDHEYAHLFSGAIESVAAEQQTVVPVSREKAPDKVSALEARVAQLEENVSAMRQTLQELAGE